MENFVEDDDFTGARLDNLAIETTSHNENAYWMYHRCTDAIKEMQSEMTALQIAPIVCGVVTKIEVTVEC